MRSLILRLMAIVPVLIGASIFSFSLTHMAPGDPVDVLLGPYATEVDRASLRSDLGLDQPLPVQYVRWIGNAATGDLGTSIQMRSPVTSVLSERFVNTLRLGVPTFGLALIVGFAAGALAALRTDGLLDKSLQGVVIFAGTVPVFWLGLVLIYWFSIRLGWFPASGMGPIGRDATIWESIRYLALPVLTTVGTPAAIIARSSRSAVLEVLDEDFVWAARGRGLRSPALFLRHILKPALPDGFACKRLAVRISDWRNARFRRGGILVAGYRAADNQCSFGEGHPGDPGRCALGCRRDRYYKSCRGYHSPLR